MMDDPSLSGRRVAVYTRDEDSAGVIRQALNEVGGVEATFKSDGLSAAMADLSGRSPRLLIVDLSGDPDPTARVRELIGMCEPSTSVLAIGDINDIRLYRNIREAGATEYFFKPLVTALVARACRSILTGVQEAPHQRTGRLVFVVGVRGGCGATTIGVRTAYRLSESPPRPVLLVDLDLQAGDAALLLDATPNHALPEALAQAERVDDLFLERGLIRVTGRLDLMASLEPLHVTPSVDEDAMLALTDKLTRRYRYVVVDVPSSQAASLSRMLHTPSTLLLVSDGRLVSAREVARWRQWLGMNSAERSVLHVLNMHGAPGSLSLEEFARAAGQAPDVVIPYSREVAAAALMGIKARPDCPTLDRGLEPVISMLSGGGSAGGRAKKSILERVLG